jgi:hypothetical protein
MTKDEFKAAMLAEITKRQGDYDRNVVEAQKKLVETWRAAHPECAAEPASGKYRPLDQIAKGNPKDWWEYPEQWTNDIYFVSVRRWPDDPVFGSRGGMVQIGINSHDGKARHDWRDMQGIKNQIAGEECEAFELYPAESRLIDPSNYYTLWCFPGVKRLKVGVDQGRRVLDADKAMAPQRAFQK